MTFGPVFGFVVVVFVTSRQTLVLQPAGRKLKFLVLWLVDHHILLILEPGEGP